MTKRIALAALFLATLGIGAAYASAFLPGGAPPWAAWLLVLGTGTVLTAAMTLGAMRNGRVGRAGWAIAFTWLVIVGGFGAVLLLPPVDPLDPALWLGLPPRAAIVMYGIGLLPFFVVPVTYALTFEEQTLGEAELERVRREARALRAATRPAVADEPVLAGVAASGEVRR
jgi:hypothetical protein